VSFGQTLIVKLEAIRNEVCELGNLLARHQKEQYLTHQRRRLRMSDVINTEEDFMSLPTRVTSRLTAALKKYQPILHSAKARDVNESDTALIATDLLHEIFGFDKYTEITSEFMIRSTFCDLAIKIDGKLHLLVEVKAVGTDLKDQHAKQAVDYAANQGVEWVVLTNAVGWRVYSVGFTKPLTSELVAELDLLTLNPRSSTDLDTLFLLTREGIVKSALTEYHEQRQAMNRFLLGALLLSDPLLSVVRRELRRLSPGVKISTEEIQTVLAQEVLKREVVEGDKADEARSKLRRLVARTQRTVRSPTPTGGAASSAVATEAS
jgi:hypothetical protein